ncbi:unnamed protein product [Chrysoparadoxa australica]
MSSFEDMNQANEALKLHSAQRAAFLVRHACKGMGTDDSAIIDILCGRTKAQLKQIDKEYRRMYERTLSDQLDSEISGDYGKLIQYAIMERDEFDAFCLSKAMDGMGTDEDLLIEIFHTRTNDEIAAMKAKWEGQKDSSLVDRLSSEVGGKYLRTLFLNILQGSRGSGDDEGAAAEQAQALYDAGVGKTFGTDEEVFVNIFGTCSSDQIQLIKKEYEAAQGQSLEKAIKKEFRGDLEDCLVAMLQPPVGYWCTLLRKATEGMGTDEKTICRVLGGADREQVQEICSTYYEKYDTILADTLKKELRGKFERACLAWIAPNSDPTAGVELRRRAAGDDEEALAALVEEENEALKNHMAKIDAKEIMAAGKGMGTDTKRIISILCARTKTQIERIDLAFRALFEGKTLKEELESELSGDTEDFLVYVQMEAKEFDAAMLKKATSGLGTNEGLLVEILCTRSPAAIAAAKEVYEGRNDASLVDRITSEVHGTLQDILLTIVNGERDTSEEADEGLAEEQADQLREASEGMGTKEEVFVEILSKSSPAQVAAIREAYESKYAESLVKMIKGEFGGDTEDALLALATTPIDFMCMELKNAMDGIGTKDSKICRILGGANKATVYAICERYKEKYDVELATQLKGELSGNFRRAVLTWITPADVAGGLAEEEEEDED